MKTAGIISWGGLLTVTAFTASMIAVRAADPASPAAPPAPKVTMPAESAPAAGQVTAAPDVGQRMKTLGYQPGDLDLPVKDSRLRTEITGPVPALARGHFARFLDSINPFGHDVPVQARPNSALIVGNAPPVAGWRNEISHEPVGMTLISISR